MCPCIQKVSPSETTNFIYDGINVIEDTDQTGTARVSYYTHGPRIDEVLSAKGQFFYLADGQGSVTAITDNTGITNSYIYDSYGNVTGGIGPRMLASGGSVSAQKITTGFSGAAGAAISSTTPPSAAPANERIKLSTIICRTIRTPNA